MSYARLFTSLWTAMSPEGAVLAGIDRHDVGIRVQQARRFFVEGQKVQLVAIYKGRKMAKNLSY